MERVITAVESVRGGRKRKVYVNDEWCFSLYPAQLRSHNLEEGMVLTEELYGRICAETLLPQAKKRVLNLLVAKDRSRKGIGREVIDEAFEVFREERIAQMGEAFEEAELTALRRQIARKTKAPAALSQKEIQKLTASLCAKGFRGADIRDVLKDLVSTDIPEMDMEL